MQSITRDKFHDQEQRVTVFINFEDFANKRMIERSGGQSFAAQAFARLRVAGHVGQ